MENVIAIGDKTFKTEEKEVSVVDLSFYEENPRIYSMIQASGLSQEEIENKMCSFEHVKALAQSIKKVGLIDPIIVRQKDMAVLEGNSRLAAHKILIKKNPHSFAKIKARVIIDDISDEDIDILLGQYHIVGRKDWEPYEQAAFMSRQIKRGMDKSALAESYGMSVRKLNNFVEVYTFMQENNILNPSEWSYYEEYLKARNIKKIREDDECREDLDRKTIMLVATKEIKNSNQDIRKLDSICETASNTRRSRIFNDFLDDNITFEEANDRVAAGADANSVITTCEKFKKFISSNETRDHIEEMNSSDKARFDFEAKKIVKALSNLGY